MHKSKQYSFINNTHGFSISFIEGHAAMGQISKIHNIGPYAYDFYHKTLLSSLQMINFIKPNERLGFYIDSEEPYYRYKVEISPDGHYRTLLLPEDFDDFPTTLTGKCRISKMTPRQAPYLTVLEFKEHKLEDIVNEVIEKSYQNNALIKISEDKSNSLMIVKLPPANVNSKIEDFEDLSLKQITTQYKDLFEQLLQLKHTDVEEAEQILKDADFHYIGSKEISFHCPCSKKKMVENLFSLPKADREHIFAEKPAVEIRCDYCNSIYDVHKDDLDEYTVQ